MNCAYNISKPYPHRGGFRCLIFKGKQKSWVPTQTTEKDALKAAETILQNVMETGRSPKEVVAEYRKQTRRPVRPIVPVLRRRSPAALAKQRQQQLKKYGLTLESYKAMLATQNGGCAICLEVTVSLRRLHVDHCHATGKVRGLLCGKCNSLLGFAEDSRDIIRQALLYLEAHTPP